MRSRPSISRSSPSISCFTLALGLWVARRQRSAGDYFLGARDLPAWAVLLSIVATETSALTVISIPGIGARGDLTFLQLRSATSSAASPSPRWLLPGLLQGRAGNRLPAPGASLRPGHPARHLGVFLVTRFLGDGVRIFAGAIPLALVTGWSVPGRDHRDGHRDPDLHLVGRPQGGRLGRRDPARRSTSPAASRRSGSPCTWRAAPARALARRGRPASSRVINPTINFTTTYTLLGGMLGGAMLSAPHRTAPTSSSCSGCSPPARSATRRLRLVGSGVVVMSAVPALPAGRHRRSGRRAWRPTGMPGDQVFSGVHRAAPAGRARRAGDRGHSRRRDEHHSSAINALASSVTHDFYASITGRRDPAHLLRVGQLRVAGLGHRPDRSRRWAFTSRPARPTRRPWCWRFRSRRSPTAPCWAPTCSPAAGRGPARAT